MAPTPAPPDKAVSVHRTRLLPVMPKEDRLAPFKATPTSPLIISVSELGAFLRCRSRWYWSYMAGLRRHTDSKEYRSIGIAVHDILERFYEAPLRERTRAHMRLVVNMYLRKTKFPIDHEKTTALVRAMCVGYAAWACAEDKAIGMDRCYPEEWFELPLVKDGSILVRGKIDNRFKPTNLKRTMACQETKTKGQMDISAIDLNFQHSTYLWAMRTKFPKYRRFIAYHTILRRQMPGPRVKAALFMRTEALERDVEQIDRWVRDVQAIAQDIIDGPRIYPNVQSSCSWDCDFYNPCLLRAAPADARHVLRNEYTTDKEKR